MTVITSVKVQKHVGMCRNYFVTRNKYGDMEQENVERAPRWDPQYYYVILARKKKYANHKCRERKMCVKQANEWMLEIN